MEEPVKKGTKVIVDRHSLPTNRHKPYGSSDSLLSTVDGVIDSITEWSPGEWRYGIKIGTSKTVFPIRRSDFQIVETQNGDK